MAFSSVEHAFVLDDVCRIRDYHRGVFCDRRRSSARVDGICALSALPSAGPGEGLGARICDHEHCDFLYRVVDGGAEFYYTTLESAGQGHDYDAHASDGMVVVHHGDFGIAGVWSTTLGGHSSLDG